MFGSGREPTLEDILSGPIVVAVMRADAVDAGELGAMLSNIARALREASRSIDSGNINGSR